MKTEKPPGGQIERIVCGHTPGPWTVGSWLAVFSAHGRVCTVVGSGKEARANARLIAEVPALVAMLQECADDLEAEIRARADGELPRRIERDMATVHRARAAIAKALGEPPNAGFSGPRGNTKPSNPV